MNTNLSASLIEEQETHKKNRVITNLKPVRLGRIAAAAYLGLSVRSVDYLIAQRRLSAKRDGGKVYVLLSDLDRYASSDHSEPIRPMKAAAKGVKA
jgi:excisionase family DNA binding protein